jgi:hypothetical protein
MADGLWGTNINAMSVLQQRSGITGQIDPSAPVPSSRRVYMGPEYQTPWVSGKGSGGGGDGFMSINKAEAMFDFMLPERYALIQQYASSQSGTNVKSTNSVRTAYSQLLERTANYNEIMGEQISVFDYARMGIAQRGLPQPSGGGGGGGGGSGTNVQVRLSSQSDAEALVDQALTSYLGRQADEQERANFYKLLNRVERQNPLVTQTTASGRSSSSVTTGGVNTQQVATEFALSQDDAAEYMANTQYTDWLIAKMSADPTEVIASGL